MSRTCTAAPEQLSAEEKADRLWNAVRPIVAEAIKRNNIRRGAKMNDIEANSAAVGDLVAKALMEASSLEFGRATDEEVEEARREALAKADGDLVSKLGGKQPRLVRQMRGRTLKTERGPVRLRREHLYFPDLRVGLFPLDSLIELPADSYTPRVKKDLCEALASDDYRDAAKRIARCGNSISHEHAAEIVGKVGEDVHREMFGPEAAVTARGAAPANPPELMIVQPDGSRYRTNEADRKRKGRKGDAGTVEAADPSSEPAEARESAFGEVAPRERDSGWRENKVAVVIRAEPGYLGAAGEWNAPREIVKTYVATTADVHAFGRDLKTEAERRGFVKAKEVVFVSDNGHGMPQMIEREFADREVHRVTDFEHARERLADAARIVHGDDDARRLKLYFGWKSRLWGGKTDEITAGMALEAEELAPRPAKLSELSSRPEAKALWGHVFYLEKWKGTMDYPEYRKKGWPLASSSVESACGQVGERVKHARMRWTRRGAEPVHQVKAAILSQDGRWEKRWPGPIPVLETPDLAALATAA